MRGAHLRPRISVAIRHARLGRRLPVRGLGRMMGMISMMDMVGVVIFIGPRASRDGEQCRSRNADKQAELRHSLPP